MASRFQKTILSEEKELKFPEDAVFLIDVSGFIFRAYYALPPLTRSDKTPVGAVFGFCQMMLKLFELTKSEKMIAVCDAGRKTFRNELYPQYKASRKETPEDLIPQFSIIDQACIAFGLPVMREEGFEADDLIASCAHHFSKQGNKVIIVSADKDLMQLVNDDIIMFDPLKSKLIDHDGVIEKFGVSPDKVIDVQSLMGDSSDNIPGVPGIGPKTARDLILEFGTLDAVYNGIEAIKQNKRRETLIENKEMAYLSKNLVTLKTDIPVQIDGWRIKENDDDLFNFLKEQGFENLYRRLKSKRTNSVDKKRAIRTLIVSPEKLKEWLKLTHKKGVLAFDTETTSLHIHQAKLVGISLATFDDQNVYSAYIPIAHRFCSQEQLDICLTRDVLSAYLCNGSISKVAHNLKFDWGILIKHGFNLPYPALGYHDTMLMSYCLNGGSHGHSLDELAKRYLDTEPTSFKDVMQKGYESFADVEIEAAKNYACEDAEITLMLFQQFWPQVPQKRLANLYCNVEQPLVAVVASMEEKGVKVNAEHLKKLGEDFSARLLILEQEIYAIAGVKFNPSSAKQLGEILFHNMQIPGGKKTKSGQFVTDAKVLERLASEGYELPKKIVEWRGLIKLRSTYVEGLLAAVEPSTGRIHTSYSLAGTATGRFSSSDPNLQNIPVRTQDGQQIRRSFIAEDGYVLASFDYSQIELRLLAHFSQDPQLLTAFREGQDIHKQTAALVFDTPFDQVSREQRSHAKAVNFGIIYGISAFGLSQQLSIPTSEAQDIINRYMQKYPKIADYISYMQDMAQRDGYVTTLMGRRCYTQGIHDNNYNVKQFALRQAANAPLQGTNADMIKLAMVHIYQLLQNEPTNMLLQVHDELIFEGPEENIRKLAPLIRRTMENILSLSVPVVVDGKLGINWQDMSVSL